MRHTPAHGQTESPQGCFQDPQQLLLLVAARCEVRLQGLVQLW
jgi:hypothetical protein